MARGGQEIQAPVAEIVERFEPADLQRGSAEIQFCHGAVCEFTRQDWRRWGFGVSWGKGLLDSRADDERGGLWEETGSAYVVPMGMAGGLGIRQLEFVKRQQLHEKKRLGLGCSQRGRRSFDLPPHHSINGIQRHTILLKNLRDVLLDLDLRAPGLDELHQGRGEILFPVLGRAKVEQQFGLFAGLGIRVGDQKRVRVALEFLEALEFRAKEY